MKVVIIGDFPVATKCDIIESFPAGWEVQVVSPMAAEGALDNAEVVIPEHFSIDAELLQKAPRLKLVQTGAGYDHVDVAACRHRGVAVCNAAGVNAAAVAEHALAMMLCWYKNVASLDRCMKQGKEAYLAYRGAELSEKTLGIVGLGHVGRRLAVVARALGMRVLGYSYRPMTVEGVTLRPLAALYEECDVISLHVPLVPDTRRMIDAETLARMKPDALLVNTSRGGLVDETALVAALKEGRIGGACLDVFEEEPLSRDHPLRALENVILTPHTAGYPDGVKFHKKRYAFFVENIERLLRGEPLASRVDR